MLFKKTLFASLFLLPTASQAIVNIEALRMNENELGWSSQVSLSMSGKKGNTDTDTSSLGLGVQFVEPQSRTFLIGSGEYGRSDGVVDDEEYFAHLRHTHRFTKKLDWEVFTQYENKPFESDNSRSLVGAGFRAESNFYGFVGHTGLGIMHEQESVTDTNNETIEESNKRFNLFADLKYRFSEESNWVGLIYYQPKVDDFSDHQYVVSTGVDATVAEPVKLAFDVAYRYDSTPLGGVLQKNDMTYNFSINIEF